MTISSFMKIGYGLCLFSVDRVWQWLTIAVLCTYRYSVHMVISGILYELVECSIMTPSSNSLSYFTTEETS